MTIFLTFLIQRAVLSLDEQTIVNNPTGCTEGGHEGVKNSKCYITCAPQYDMEWVDESIPDWKTRAVVTCTWKGQWKGQVLNQKTFHSLSKIYRISSVFEKA